MARLVRGNTYMRLSYDLTDHISIYGSAIYSEVVTWDKPTQSFFKSDNLHIGCDNPYLPTSVAQACLQNNGQNAAYNSQQFWDGRSPSLEDQSLHPFTNPIEMGLKDHQPILDLVRSESDYAALFKLAFKKAGAGITMKEVTQAIGA